MGPTQRYPQTLDGPPSWFPDGKRVLFYREHVDTRRSDEISADLFIVPVSGGRPAPLTRPPDIWEFDPAVSPDGHTVVFSLSDQRSGPSAIAGGLFLLRTDGTKPRRLTTSPRFSNDGPPSWSPDGERIAFSRERSNGKSP